MLKLTFQYMKLGGGKGKHIQNLVGVWLQVVLVACFSVKIPYMLLNISHSLLFVNLYYFPL